MKIAKSTLLEILEALRPGLASDDIIDNSDAICFADDTILTYNDKVWVVYPLETGFEGSVKEDRFFKHLKKAGPDKEGNITLEHIDGDLIIRSGLKGKTQAGIPMIPLTGEGNEMPDILEWKKLPKNFMQGVQKAMACAGSNYNKPKLTCVHIKDNIIESSDGQRALRFRLVKKIKDEFMLPAEAIPAIIKRAYTKYALADNWAFFKTAEGVITSLRMYADNEYPDTAFLFDMDDNDEFVFPDELKGTIDRAVDFIGQDEETAYLHLKIDGKRIMVSSKSDHGWFKEPVKLKTDINISFFVNPFFLKEIFKSTHKAELDSARGLLKFVTDDWDHVINISVD